MAATVVVCVARSAAVDDGVKAGASRDPMKGPPPSDALHATNPTAEGAVVWFTGLPASGKSTLAQRAYKRVRRAGVACCLLDGDAVRAAFEPTPRYDAAARADFYVTLANLAALLAHQGMVVMVAATAHLRLYRQHARQVAPHYIEVYVALPLHHCKQRDTKGMYAAAQVGAIDELPGIGVIYQPPAAADVTASGGKDTAALRQVVAHVLAMVRVKSC